MYLISQSLVKLQIHVKPLALPLWMPKLNQFPLPLLRETVRLYRIANINIRAEFDSYRKIEFYPLRRYVFEGRLLKLSNGRVVDWKPPKCISLYTWRSFLLVGPSA